MEVLALYQTWQYTEAVTPTKVSALYHKLQDISVGSIKRLVTDNGRKTVLHL